MIWLEIKAAAPLINKAGGDTRTTSVSSDWLILASVSSDWLMLASVSSDWLMLAPVTSDWLILVPHPLIG